MATKYLSANANASAATWLDAPAGSPTTAPTTGDDADLNTKTLTIDQTFTCDNIVGAGTLAVSGNRTINANIGNSTAAFGCTLNGASQTVTLNGNIRGGVTATKISVSGATTTLTMTGNVVGGDGSNIRGIAQTNGIVSIAGTVTGGAASGGIGVLISTAGTLTIVGNVTGTAAVGVQASAGTVTITGDVNSTGALQGYLNTSTTPITTINGNVTGSSGGAAAGASNATGTLTINGSVTGGSTNSAACYGAVNTGTGRLIISGTVTAGSGTPNSAANTPFGAFVSAGTLDLTGSIADSSVASAVCHAGGTFNYTPTSVQTATIGGKVLYPSTGGVTVPTNVFGAEGVYVG